MADIFIEKRPYGGWNNCLYITNGIIDLIVTLDVGPRIIRCGFAGKKNAFCEIEEMMGLTGGDEWRLYGGHRLWHSPEDLYRTYEPDNGPVDWTRLHGGVKVIQAVETRTNLRKEMEISLSPDSAEIVVLHRLTNMAQEPVELSLWSITAMATGGKVVIPIKGRETGLLPNRSLVLWPYTRLNDSRLMMGDRYIIIGQDRSRKDPLKIGLANEEGWAAYFNDNILFLKQYRHDTDSAYPDFGSSYETYTNDFMLEMESLSPLSVINPGASAVHREQWKMIDNIPYPSDNEQSIENVLRNYRIAQ